MAGELINYIQTRASSASGALLKGDASPLCNRSNSLKPSFFAQLEPEKGVPRIDYSEVCLGIFAVCSSYSIGRKLELELEGLSIIKVVPSKAKASA